jgi:MoaA/NifB/PqqE/SkfB family radical SAM enzyme
VTIEQAEKNLRDLKELGVQIIDFTGGEPTLHRQLPELLELARTYGFITTVTTNGLLYPKRAKQLAGKIDMLHFSLDYFDREKHDLARGVPCYDAVMQSIDIALSLGEKPDILMTVLPDNLDQIDPIYHKITRQKGLVLILNPGFDYNDIHTNVLDDQAIRELSHWGKRKGVFLNEAFLQLRKDGGNHVDNPVCKAGSSTIVVSPDNHLVVPCYHLGVRSFPINGDLLALYHSESVQAVVAMEGRMPECEGCVINCYMQPSFTVEMNKYFWKALPSTITYNRLKGTYKALFRKNTRKNRKLLETTH